MPCARAGPGPPATARRAHARSSRRPWPHGAIKRRPRRPVITRPLIAGPVSQARARLTAQAYRGRAGYMLRRTRTQTERDAATVEIVYATVTGAVLAGVALAA